MRLTHQVKARVYFCDEYTLIESERKDSIVVYFQKEGGKHVLLTSLISFKKEGFIFRNSSQKSEIFSVG